MNARFALPPGVTVLERGWLSANNVLFVDEARAAVVDTGYCTHADQTLALLRDALHGRELDLVCNTHLHSDHCGGNAALQAAWPDVRTLVPPGQAAQVRDWDPVALSYVPTGQSCPRFRTDGVLAPGDALRLGGREWQVHASPGHDPHAVVLFEPRSRTLLSADALWENGFGVVFPELEGASAFDDVAATLDCIERLAPLVVVPGHGSVFGGQAAVSAALARARKRLDSFRRDPLKNASHAIKVLLKFKLLEWQTIRMDGLREWTRRTPYFALVHARYFGDIDSDAWLLGMVEDLVRVGAAMRAGGELVNT